MHPLPLPLPLPVCSHYVNHYHSAVIMCTSARRSGASSAVLADQQADTNGIDYARGTRREKHHSFKCMAGLYEGKEKEWTPDSPPGGLILSNVESHEIIPRLSKRLGNLSWENYRKNVPHSG